MTRRKKYLLGIPALLLLAVGLLLYKIVDVSTFLLERELRAAGFSDIVVEIKSVTNHQSTINTLHARHPAFNLRIDGITLRYTLSQLLSAQIDSIDIAALQLDIHEQASRPGSNTPALPAMLLLPHSFRQLPVNHVQISKARLHLPEAIQGVSSLDLKATITRSNSELDAQLSLYTTDRPALLLELIAHTNDVTITLNDETSTSTAVTLHSSGLVASTDKLNMTLAIEAELDVLRALASRWLPKLVLPEIFDTFNGEGELEYNTATQQLQTDLDISLTGRKQQLLGPVSLNYQAGQLELILNTSFSIEAHKQQFAQVSIPELRLVVKDDINCAYQLVQTSWQCGQGRIAVKLPELRYPPYTLRSEAGMLTLQQLQGESIDWRLTADLDLPTVKIELPDNVIQVDRLLTQLQATPNAIKATANLQAADGKLAMDISARHDLQQQRGNAEITLQPVSLAAGNNIPGKVLRRWPYPLHIESGTLLGKTNIHWQEHKDRWLLDQTSSLQLDNIQGRIRQYPFNGLNARLLIKGIDKLHISATDGIRLASINPGVPVTDILLQADVSRKKNKAPVIQLQHLEASTLGGTLSADKALLDLNRDDSQLLLSVRGLDIAELVKLEQKQGLYGTGVLSGTLPIIFSRNGLSMSAGTLSTQPPHGVIRYTGDERLSTLAKSNPNVNLLVKALDDFHYDLLEAKIDYAPDGQLLAKVSLQGRNPELEGGRPVHLNINLEENILTLLRSLQFADEIGRKIGEGIEQGIRRP